MAEIIARWDRRGRLALLPWSHGLATCWMEKLTPEVRDASMHVKLSDGRLVSGDETFAVLLCFLPGARRLGRLGRRNAIAGRLLASVYAVVARKREFLSRLAPCRRPVVVEPASR
jgi:hypothetical protein